MGGNLNLLLIEDDAGFAAALAGELTTLGHDLTVVGTGTEGLSAVERDRFDAVILDRMLPGMDGATVVRRLREVEKAIPVLMLSALDRSLDKIAGLDAGADDYATKPTPAAEIDARLKAMIRARGWTTQATDTLRAGDIVASPAQCRVWRDGQPIEFTRLEFKLLLELMRHAGGFVTRAMLLQSVWGYDFEPTTNIVEGQIRAVRRKLTATGGTDPIVTQRGIGYMLTA